MELSESKFDQIFNKQIDNATYTWVNISCISQSIYLQLWFFFDEVFGELSQWILFKPSPKPRFWARVALNTGAFFWFLQDDTLRGGPQHQEMHLFN